MAKIPNQAKCVFKGEIFDVYQWQQELYDGSFDTFEALRRDDCVTVIARTKDEKFIINFEEQPMNSGIIAVPGGRVDPCEDELTAAKRELQEETGYISENWQKITVLDLYNLNKIEASNHLYLAKDCVKVSEQDLDAGEKIDVKLFTKAEFLQLLQDSKFRNKDVVRFFAKETKVYLDTDKISNLF